MLLFQVTTSQPGSQKHSAAAMSKKTEVSLFAVYNGLHHTASIETEEHMVHVYLQFCIWIHVGKAKIDSGAV